MYKFLALLLIISCSDKIYDTSKAVDIFSDATQVTVDYTLSEQNIHPSENFKIVHLSIPSSDAEISNGIVVYMVKNGDVFKIVDGIKTSVKTHIKHGILSNICDNHIAVLGKNGEIAMIDLSIMNIVVRGSISKTDDTKRFTSKPELDGVAIYTSADDKTFAAFSVQDFSKLWDFSSTGIHVDLALQKRIFSINSKIIALFSGSNVTFLDKASGAIAADIDVKDDAVQSLLSIDGATFEPQIIDNEPIIIQQKLSGIIGIHSEYLSRLWNLAYKPEINIHSIRGTSFFAFADVNQNLIVADSKTGGVKWFEKLKDKPLSIMNNENIQVLFTNKIVSYNVNYGEEILSEKYKIKDGAQFYKDGNVLYIINTSWI